MQNEAAIHAALTAELSDLRDASRATSADRQPVALDQQSVGRLSRMDAMQQQAMAAAQQTRRNARIRAIEAALRRLADGEYGWCTDCGEAVEPARLRHDPRLPRCRDCVGG